MTYEFGILAALTAPLVMTIGLIVWDKHWKGSAFALNLYKCCTASIGFLILSLATRANDLFPSDLFTRTNVGFLMLSSTIGILIGDWTWLQGMKLLGVGRVIIVDSIKPFLAALFGWALLDERLTGAHFGGMALTVVGIMIVSFENKKPVEENKDGSGEEPGSISSENEGASEDEEDANGGEEEVSDANNVNLSGHDRVVTSLTGEEHPEEFDVELTTDAARVPCEIALGHRVADGGDDEAQKKARTPASLRKGYFYSAVNVVLDTYGSFLTKRYGSGMSTWEINLVRFGFAAACMLALSLVLYTRQKVLETKRKSQNSDDQATATTAETADKAETAPWYLLPSDMVKRSWIQVSLGVLFVTFFTPALSNYALFQIALALALTLGSISPLYALPLLWLLQRKRPTLRATLGALLAVGGIALMSYQGTPGDD